MAMTSVSVMMTVFVLNLHYRGPKKNEIPFWLQQFLSLSLVNIARTFRKSKKIKLPCTRKKPIIRKESTQDTNKNQSIQNRIPANGLLLSYTNVNETRPKSRITTNVSLLNEIFILFSSSDFLNNENYIKSLVLFSHSSFRSFLEE
jgi:hypothetical protein